MMKEEELFLHISGFLRDSIKAYRKLHSSSQRLVYEVLTITWYRYLVKIWSLKGDDELITLKQEEFNYRRISDILSLKVVFYTTYQDKELLITDFIDQPRYDNRYIQNLWVILQKLNKESLPHRFKKKYFLSELLKYRHIHIEGWYTKKTSIDYIYIYLYYYQSRFLHATEPLFLTHGDLHLGNILKGPWWVELIDWEALDYRIKESDLVSCIYTHRFNSKQVETFLYSYWYPIWEEYDKRLSYLYIYYVFKTLEHNRHVSKLEYRKEIAMLCKSIHQNLSLLQMVDMLAPKISYINIKNAK